MTPYEYLRQMCEPLPRWLGEFTEGCNFDHAEFFASRIVYYPGSGTDGHPVKLFGSTHSAHSFVYVDYGITRRALEAELEHHSHRFRGYHTLARRRLVERDLAPRGWVAHLNPMDAVPHGGNHVAGPPFAFLEVLERDQELDDDHGARRLAILFLGADGIAAYDALFCREPIHLPPFAIVLQDHGFGGNYDQFGQGSLMEQMARRCGVIPPWLLLAENTRPWDEFERVPAVEGDPGGMHATPRFLYHRREK